MVLRKDTPNVHFTSTPEVKHDSYAEACDEAEKLVKTTGGTFYILEALAITTIDVSLAKF